MSRMVDDLRNTAAVEFHGKGVSSVELADFVSCVSQISQSRIKGTGAEQYAHDGRQKFEEMNLDELVEGFTEEICDAQNYLAMILIKILAYV
jgi:hypothetical protein